MNERLAQIAQSVEHETLNPRVVGSSLHEKLQKLQMITGLSSNNSSISLECHDCPAIRCLSTPCFRLEGSIVKVQPERNAASSVEHDEHRGRSRYQSSQITNAFPETVGKSITNFHEHSPKDCSISTPQKGMRAPKYNYAQRMRKFTGCMQSKRELSVEWISNDNQQSLCMNNGNVEPVCVVKEKSQRQSHSNANLYDRMHQCTLAHVTAPATADNGASVTSTRVYVRRTFPAMSTCSLAQQRGMWLSSPTTAYPPEIEWDVAATNAICSVSLLQNVGLNTPYDRARNSESMLQSYIHSYERRPKVYMACTKGSVQHEKERESDSARRPAERREARPSKKGRRCHSPRPSQYVCLFCKKVNKQRTNHKRHMVMKHGCRLDGTEATAEDLAQARAWASKERPDRSQQFKSKEYVSSDSDSDDDDTSESSSSSRRSVRSPSRQRRRADCSPSEASSRSPSPAVPAPPKVRKVCFEVDEPLTGRGDSRARKQPAKPVPSTSKAAGPVPSILELDIPVPSPRKVATAQRSKKPATTVRSEVHMAPKPSTSKKKGVKSSAAPEAQTEAVTPKKRLVIETPRLEQMVEVAKKAVQNLKDTKELPPPGPEIYRPTYGPTSKQSKVKGTSVVTGKGKAAMTAPMSAESRPSKAVTTTLAPIPETSVITTADLSIEEAQNRANQVLFSEERSVPQLRVDLELSSDTNEDESKAQPVRQPKFSDVEPSDSEVEVPVQTSKTDEELPVDPKVGTPEIIAEFQESIVISEEENGAEQSTPSASTSTAPQCHP